MAVFFAGPLIIIVLLIVLLSAALFVVPQQQAYIIERFGKFLKVQFAGIHIRIPFVDRIAMKTNMRVNQLNVQLETKTLDNVFVTVVASTQFRVNPNDVATAYYELRDPAAALLHGGRAAFRYPCTVFGRCLCPQGRCGVRRAEDRGRRNEPFRLHRGQDADHRHRPEPTGQERDGLHQCRPA